MHQLRETAISFLCPKCKRFCSSKNVLFLFTFCDELILILQFPDSKTSLPQVPPCGHLPLVGRISHSHLYIFIAFAFLKKHMTISMYLTYVLKFHLINYMFEHVFSLVGLYLHSQHIQCSMQSSLSLQSGVQQGRQGTKLPLSIS